MRVAALVLAAGCGHSKHEGSASGSSSSAPADDAGLQLPVVPVGATRPARAFSFVRIDRGGALTMGDVPAAARTGGAIALGALGAGKPITGTELFDRYPPMEAPSPPRPSPELAPPSDDDQDESGGVGTAMALDEGKMGKKDEQRAAGEYKMKQGDDHAQLTRAQAIEAAKHAGILSSVGGKQGAFASLTGTDDAVAGGPHDLDAHALDGDGGEAASLAPVLIADARAPARALLDVVHDAGGAATIAVQSRAGDPARVLDVAFGIGSFARDDVYVEPPVAELVLSFDATGAHLAAGAVAAPTRGGPGWSGPADPAAIADAYAKARSTAEWKDRNDLRVVVDDHVTVGVFVGALAAIAGRGARTFEVGPPR